VNLSAADCY